MAKKEIRKKWLYVSLVLLVLCCVGCTSNAGGQSVQSGESVQTERIEREETSAEEAEKPPENVPPAENETDHGLNVDEFEVKFRNVIRRFFISIGKEELIDSWQLADVEIIDVNADGYEEHQAIFCAYGPASVVNLSVIAEKRRVKELDAMVSLNTGMTAEELISMAPFFMLPAALYEEDYCNYNSLCMLQEEITKKGTCEIENGGYHWSLKKGNIEYGLLVSDYAFCFSISDTAAVENTAANESALSGETATAVSKRYERDNETGDIIIYDVSANEELMFFTASWYRANGFGGVACKRGEVWEFDVLEGNDFARGTIAYQEDTVSLQIAESNIYCIEAGNYQYDFKEPLDLDSYVQDGLVDHEIFWKFFTWNDETGEKDTWCYAGQTYDVFKPIGESYTSMFHLYKVVRGNGEEEYFVVSAYEDAKIYKVNEDGSLRAVKA